MGVCADQFLDWFLTKARKSGALDGRHPAVGKVALGQIQQALVKGGRLFIDGGNPLKEIEFGAS